MLFGDDLLKKITPSKNDSKFIFSIGVVTILICIFSLLVKYYSSKQVPYKAPNLFICLVEKYVLFFSGFYKETSESKLKSGSFYIFALFNFLFLSNIISLFGLKSPTAHYSIPFLFTMMTWIVIVFLRFYTLGFLGFFIKIINPLEFVGLFSIIISLSFRIFGNVLGGSIIYTMVYDNLLKYNYQIFGSDINFLGLFITPFLQIYFDIFSGLIQAYVFVLLTTLFWAQEKLDQEESNAIWKWNFFFGLKNQSEPIKQNLKLKNRSKIT